MNLLKISAYLVGGAVRDELLGLPLKDRDWVVIGQTPESMKALGFQQVGKDFPVFLHPETHEEYALARKEKKTSLGHQGFTCISDANITLEEDLSRRDLTLNAIAKSPLKPGPKNQEYKQEYKQEYIDPFQGIRDINARILRHVSPAFSEDPLRVLRVARFLAQLSEFDFKISPETLELMKKMVKSGELSHLSGERIFKEIQKALETPAPEKFFQCLKSINAESVISTKPLEIPSRPAPAHFSLTQKFIWFLGPNIKSLKFNIPNDIKDLGVLISSKASCYLSKNQLKHPKEKELVDILNKLDALRRPERFNAWGEFYAELTQNPEPQIFLTQALKALQKIDYKSIAQEKLDPKTAINQAKESASSQWLQDQGIKTDSK